MDSDDVWLPEKLDKQVQLMDESLNDVGFVYAGMDYVDIDGNIIRTAKPSHKGKLFEHLLLNVHGGVFVGAGSTPLIRKECFNTVGYFDETLPALQDMEMWIRIAKHYRSDYVPETLVKCLCHDQSITGNRRAMIKGLQQILKQYSSYFKEHNYRKGAARILHKTGNILSDLGQTKRGKVYLWTSFKKHPEFKTLIHFLFALGGNEFYRGGRKVRSAVRSFFQKIKILN